MVYKSIATKTRRHKGARSEQQTVLVDLVHLRVFVSLWRVLSLSSLLRPNSELSLTSLRSSLS